MTDHPKALGRELAAVRSLRCETLRSAAASAGISGAYLLKLERGEVQAPSPHVLRRLADHFRVSYLELMALAGYDIRDTTRSTARPGVLADALASEPLSDSEQLAIAAFLSTLRAGSTR